MTVGELIERLQSLGASYNANIIVWDRKECDRIYIISYPMALCRTIFK